MPPSKPTAPLEIPPEWDAAADVEYLRLLDEIDDEDYRFAIMAELAPSAECPAPSEEEPDDVPESIVVWDSDHEPAPEPDAEPDAAGAAPSVEPFACPGRGGLRVRKASIVEQCRECAWLSGGLGCVFKHQPAL
jgi:hypothetical protein